jgi:hypothetical protein
MPPGEIPTEADSSEDGESIELDIDSPHIHMSHLEQGISGKYGIYHTILFLYSPHMRYPMRHL